jgi:hypothetical protein
MRNHRKPLQADNPTWKAHSTYTADLGGPDRHRYRRTPPGSATVADLVRPGDTVSTSYSTGGVVIAVKEFLYAAPTGEPFRIWRSSMCRPIEPRIPRLQSPLDQRVRCRRRPHPKAVRRQHRRGPHRRPGSLAPKHCPPEPSSFRERLRRRRCARCEPVYSSCQRFRSTSLT